MAAIIVKSALYPDPKGRRTHLRISVDRSLAAAGGPAAGIVATVAVTEEGGYTRIPDVPLWSTRGAADAITEGAIYKAEWLDSAGGVTPVKGLEIFRIDIPCAATTWGVIEAYTQAWLVSQSDQSNGLGFGLNTNPTIFRSPVTVLGADVSHSDQAIVLVFGRGPNAPMLCADLNGLMLSQGNTTVLISAQQPVRVVSLPATSDIVPANDANLLADTTSNDVTLQLQVPGTGERNQFYIYNLGLTGNSVRLLPPTGQAINGLAPNTPFIFSGAEQMVRAIYSTALAKYIVNNG
jgi:hypothetical protein